ncbi:MAG: sigma-70 family RNA polymerase sigma factor [Erythrobacter sp.]
MKTDDDTLARLMGMAQSGDAAAYRTVLDACQNWLARYFSGRVAPHALDDLIQETFMAMHRKRATFDPARPFLPWLAAFARYRWLDHLRGYYRHEAEELSETVVGETAFDDAVLAQVSLDRMLARVSPAQATVIRLVKIEGLSIEEASQLSGQSAALVKVNTHRGLKKLANHIESV